MEGDAGTGSLQSSNFFLLLEPPPPKPPLPPLPLGVPPRPPRKPPPRGEPRPKMGTLIRPFRGFSNIYLHFVYKEL
jgi:hypothetical protein